jgi:hypothetical protein
MTAEVKTYGEGSSMYSVRQTDCRTGWLAGYELSGGQFHSEKPV